jgi:hypothetical protein
LASFGLILFGFFVSAFVNQTPLEIFIKGFAILFFAFIGIMIVWLSTFTRPGLDILPYLIGLVIASVYTSGMNFSWEAQELNPNHFKATTAGAALFFSLIVGLLVSKKSLNLAILFLLITGTVIIALDARSTGLSLILATIVFGILQARRALDLKLSTALFLVCLIAYTFYVLYVFTVLWSHSDTPSFQQLNTLGNPYNPFALIGVGRTEFLVGFNAALDNPVLGFGPGAIDESGFYGTELIRLSGRPLDEESSSWDIVPAHSVILSLWHYGGLLSLLGGIGLIIFTCRFGVVAAERNDGTGLLVCWALVMIVWDGLFSPIGHLRISFPLYVGIVLASHTQTLRLALYSTTQRADHSRVYA